MHDELNTSLTEKLLTVVRALMDEAMAAFQGELNDRRRLLELDARSVAHTLTDASSRVMGTIIDEVGALASVSTKRVEYQQCAECTVKPGFPELCAACYHNRTVIDRLAAEVKRQRTTFRYIRDLCQPPVFPVGHHQVKAIIEAVNSELGEDSDEKQANVLSPGAGELEVLDEG